MIDDTNIKKSLIPNFKAFQLMARRITPSLFLGNNEQANLPTIAEEDISDFDIAAINYNPRFTTGIKPVTRQDLKDMAQSILDNDGLYKIQFWAAKKSLLRENKIDLNLTVPIEIPLYEALGLYFIGTKDRNIYVSEIEGDSIEDLEEYELPEIIEKDKLSEYPLQSTEKNTPSVLDELILQSLNNGRTLKISRTSQGRKNEEEKEIEILLCFTRPQHEFASKPPKPIPIKLIV